MKILMTGASGYIGTSLQPFLTAVGQQVVSLKRAGAPLTSSTPAWNPLTGEIGGGSIEGANAVIHLAGANIGAKRWTRERKRILRESRVEPTRALCVFLAKQPERPKVLITASAIGYYGNRGDQWLDETSPRGQGFLADLVSDWELATDSAKQAGIRVVNVRFGIVLSPEGGALARMLFPFRLGLGGVMGSGRQYWSWVGLDDLVGAVSHVLVTESISGPVNVVASSPVTNREFTRILARVLHRPAILPAPALALRIALGEMADELLLFSARVKPEKLASSGYHFRQSDLERCLTGLLAR